MRSPCCLFICVCLHVSLFNTFTNFHESCLCAHLFQHLNKFTDFCETWYEHYTTAGHAAVLKNFLQSAITAWQIYELVNVGVTLLPFTLGTQNDTW
jgi:hypothetical protein